MELEIELEAGKVSNLFTKVQHEIPLKSLQDVFSYGEIYDFEKRTRKGLNFEINEEDDETFLERDRPKPDDYNLDIEKELENKFDELFGSLEWGKNEK